MEQQPTQTFRRNPFEIIGECFSIYGRYIRQFLLIALIVHIVIGAVGFVILPSDEELLLTLLQFDAMGEQGTDTSELPSLAEIAELLFPVSVYFLIMCVSQAVLGGAIACAVGMQYATGEVNAGVSYSRAFWRVLTLFMIGLLSFALVMLAIVGVVLILPGIIILTLMIYCSVATQAAVLEGYKLPSALKRSFELVLGNWWRTLAAWLLTVLVTTGLSLIIGLPLAELRGVIGLEGLAGKTIGTLVSMITGTIIVPIPGIAAALIYLDLRARSEDYDIETLSKDMGFSPRSDEYGFDAQ